MEANDMKAMREALENSNGLLEELAAIGEWGESAREQIAENNAALAAPPRNCDEGTAEEQNERYKQFCRAHEHECGLGRSARKVICPAYKSTDCAIAWEHMPYKEGGAK